MKPVFEITKGMTPADTSYCPGCSHGIAHRIIMEVLEERGELGNTIGVVPIGCSINAHHFMNVDMCESTHGRAPAIASGIRRVHPDKVVFTYQGDGDLASIGAGEILHAAHRGEKFTTFFINNAIYGMTGGQMAPTTLIGQRATTCVDGRTVEQAGLPLAERFLQRMTQSQKLHAYVQNMALLHMEPNKLAAAGAKSRSFMRLYDRSCCPEDLLLLARADFMGRQGTPEAREALEREYVPIEQTLREMLALYRERMCQPTVTGRDLIQAGCRPGEDFGEALDYAHKLRLAGLPFDQQLKQTLGYLISLRKKREKSGNTI